MTVERGAQLGPRVVTVDAAAMHVLAQALADPNPVHLDGAAAEAAGLGDRPVNQGPANFGYVLDMTRASMPRAEVTAFEVRLVGNVFAGDRVVAGGQIETVERVADSTQVRCAVWLDVEGGQRAVEGAAVLAMARS